MTDAEELQHFRAQKEVMLKRARTTAITFGILATVGLIAFVYAFFQQTEAKKAAIEYQAKIEMFTKQLQEAEVRAQNAEAAAAQQEKLSQRAVQEQSEYIAELTKDCNKALREQVEANLVRAQKAEADAKRRELIAQQIQKECDKLKKSK